MPSVNLPIGTIDYRVFGPESAEAPTAVFVHGFLVNGTLWDPVATLLADAGIRSIVPDWPLGAHRTPANDRVELSPLALGTAVVDLLAALDLKDVTLVGSDTGGAICQLALAHHGLPVRALVLTNCDAFEVFPPAWFIPLFWMARHRLAVYCFLQPTRISLVRHSPIGFGLLLGRPRSAALTRSWIQPAIGDARIRRDICRFARGLRGTELLEAASWLAGFNRPVRLVWGARDSCFTIAMARRLAAVFPQCVLTEVAGARTFVSIDRPNAVSEAITGVASGGRHTRSG